MFRARICVNCEYGTVLPWIQPANTCKASELMLKAIPAAVIGSIDLSRQLTCNDMLLYLAQIVRKKWLYVRWIFVAGQVCNKTSTLLSGG
jgi:hypothetical protein